MTRQTSPGVKMRFRRSRQAHYRRLRMQQADNRFFRGLFSIATLTTFCALALALMGVYSVHVMPVENEPGRLNPSDELFFGVMLAFRITSDTWSSRACLPRARFYGKSTC